MIFDKEKCPNSGTFTLSLPIRVLYYNREGKRWENFTSVQHSLTILPNTMTIPIKDDADSRMYLQSCDMNILIIEW